MYDYPLLLSVATSITASSVERLCQKYLETFQNVFASHGLGSRRVMVDERLDDALVTVEGGPRFSDAVESGNMVIEEVLAITAAEVDEAGIAAGSGDRVMEDIVKIGQLVEGWLETVRAVEGDDGIKLLRGRTCGGETGSVPFQSQARLVDVPNVVGSVLAGNPAAGKGADQALGGETLQCLTDRGAGGFELCCQRDLDEPLVRPDIAMDDGGTKMFVHPI